MDGATAIELAGGQVKFGVDVRLGGLPASVSGTVTVPAPADATVALEVSSPDGALNSAVVSTATTDASGNFTLPSVPSPAEYQLVVTKPGYATATQKVDLGSGEADTGVTLLLQLGDGSVAGMVSGSAGPLGGATISATGGDGGSPVTASTVSLTSARSVLRRQELAHAGDLYGGGHRAGLREPDAERLTVSGAAVERARGRPGQWQRHYRGKGGGCRGQSRGWCQSDRQRGAVVDNHGDTQRREGGHGAGTFEITGLPAPANYEVTFSRPDLVAASREVELLPGATSDPASGDPAPGDPAPVDPAPGDPASGDQASGAPSRSGPLDVTMVLATADIYGRVTDQKGKPLAGIGISVSSGRTTYAVTSVDRPVAGDYEIDGMGLVPIPSVSPGPEPSPLRQ